MNLSGNDIAAIDKVFLKRFTAEERTVTLDGNPCSKSLDLSGFGLRSFPASFFVRFTPALQRLNVDSNGIRTIPQDVSKLSQLKSFSVRNNSLVPNGLPCDILSLSSLDTLRLEGNPLFSNLNISGCSLQCEDISPILRHFSLPKLKYLDLSKNELADLDCAHLRLFLPMTNLVSLNLDGNALRLVPQWLVELPSLRRINLRRNSIYKLDFSCAGNFLSTINATWFLRHMVLLAENPVQAFHWRLLCGDIPQSLLADLFTPMSGILKLRRLTIERQVASLNKVSHVALSSQLCSIKSLDSMIITGSNVALPHCMSKLTAITMLNFRYSEITDEQSCKVLDYSRHFPMLVAFHLSNVRGCNLFWHWRRPLSKQLRFLYLSFINGSHVRNNDSWHGLEGINQINIEGVKTPAITHSPGISALTTLRSLNIAHTTIENFKLPSSISLTKLTIEGIHWRNPPNNIARYLPNLQLLQMSGTVFPESTNFSSLLNGLQMLRTIELSCDLLQTQDCVWKARKNSSTLCTSSGKVVCK